MRSTQRTTTPTSAPSDGTEPFGWLIITAVAMLAVVAGYLQVKDTALIIVALVVSFSVTSALVGLLIAPALGVPFGPGVKTQVITNAGLGAVGLIDVYLVSHPPIVPAGVDLGPIMTLGGAASISTLIGLPPEAVAYVAFQVVGLVCLVMAMAFEVLHSTKLYATLRVVVAASNDSPARPRFSTWIVQVGPTPAACFRAGIMFSLAALLLVSGAIFGLFSWLPPAIGSLLA